MLLVLAAVSFSLSILIFFLSRPKNLNKNVPKGVKNYFNGSCNSSSASTYSLALTAYEPDVALTTKCQEALTAFEASAFTAPANLVDAITYKNVTYFVPVDQVSGVFKGSTTFPFKGKLDDYTSLLAVDGQKAKTKRFYNNTIAGTYTL